MTTTLSPDCPLVLKGTLFNLVMYRADNRVHHKQFMARKDFNYTEVLEDIRAEGLIKSEDVYKRLYELLLERKILEPIESCILDVGILGRASKAVQDHYRHALNSNSSLIKRLKQELERVHFTFTGPEGEIHLLATEAGEVLGHVLVSLDDGAGLYADLTLDLIGPTSSEFPEHFETIIEEKIKTHLQDNHPGLAVGISVRVRRSELALGTGHFLW